MSPKIWTPEECEYLIANYHSYKDCEALAKDLGVPPKIVQDKANDLGFSRKNPNTPWTEEEEALLEAWAEIKLFPQLVQDWQRKAKKQGWAKRSPIALGKKLRALGYSQVPSAGYYSAAAVAAGLGVSPHQVKKWLRSGKLKSQQSTANAIHYIHEKNLADFALRYPAEVAERLSNEGMAWLLLIIRDARGRSPLYEYKRA